MKASSDISGIWIGDVAPLVGAWIESSFINLSHSSLTVAPLVGAWIESSFINLSHSSLTVAPLVGAWIERVFKS